MSLELNPIGIVHSPFQQATGTPIQARRAGSAVGTVEVFPAFAEGLENLDGFDRIWLLYGFDRASDVRGGKVFSYREPGDFTYFAGLTSSWTMRGA